MPRYIDLRPDQLQMDDMLVEGSTTIGQVKAIPAVVKTEGGSSVQVLVRDQKVFQDEVHEWAVPAGGLLAMDTVRVLRRAPR
jgi:hypothetical protein